MWRNVKLCPSFRDVPFDQSSSALAEDVSTNDAGSTQQADVTQLVAENNTSIGDIHMQSFPGWLVHSASVSLLIYVYNHTTMQCFSMRKYLCATL